MTLSSRTKYKNKRKFAYHAASLWLHPRQYTASFIKSNKVDTDTNIDGIWLAFYIYKGMIGLRTKQFNELLKNKKIKYTGEIKYNLSRDETRYYKKYSRVIPVYYLSAVQNYKKLTANSGVTFFIIDENKNLTKNKDFKTENLFLPFIYNKTVTLDYWISGEREIDEIANLPPLTTYLFSNTTNFKLMENYIKLQEEKL